MSKKSILRRGTIRLTNVYDQIRRQEKKEDLIRQVQQAAGGECQHGTENSRAKLIPSDFHEIDSAIEYVKLIPSVSQKRVYIFLLRSVFRKPFTKSVALVQHWVATSIFPFDLRYSIYQSMKVQILHTIAETFPHLSSFHVKHI
jgi:hypothetical protein